MPVADWEQEFIADAEEADTGCVVSPLGGSSSKFTMRGRWFSDPVAAGGVLPLDRHCAAPRMDHGAGRHRRGHLGEALRRVAARSDREGPWVYTSQVEDFELTYRIRELGYRCQVSPTVPCLHRLDENSEGVVGAADEVAGGDRRDLLKLGVNRLTLMDWFQQLSGIFSALGRFLWAEVILALCLVGHPHFQWLWWVALPAFFVSLQVKHALRIPHRDKIDVLFAFLIIPSEVFAWLRAAWFTAAWIQAPMSRLRGQTKDRWKLQYSAEGFKRGAIGKVRVATLRLSAVTAGTAVALLAIGNLYPASGLPTAAAVAETGTGVVHHSLTSGASATWR